MASNPPINAEDQTDEDFFDKLVEDDFGPPLPSSSSDAAVKSIDRSESDSARAFADLSFGDDSGDEERVHGEKEASDLSTVVGGNISASNVEGNGEPRLVDSHSSLAPNTLPADGNDAMKLKDVGEVSEAEAPQRFGSIGNGTVDGSLGSGIKELGWNAFNGDSSDNSAHGGLDFFSQLGNNATDFPGNTEDTTNYRGTIGTTQTNDAYFNYPVNNGEVHDSHNSIYLTSNVQDASNNQDWENMYPGWKYDHATGQWYQVDNHEQITTSQQSNGYLVTELVGASDVGTEVAYLRQSSQSVASAIAETSTSERISTWNQDSQANGGYPEHMFFDPQYPGWYYDTIGQEWRTLDSYNASFQPTGHAYDDKSQNGYASVNAHSSNGGSSVLSENCQADKHFSADLGSQGQHANWTNFNGMRNVTWQPAVAAKTKTVASSGYGENQPMDSFYGSNGFVNNLPTQQSGLHSFEKASQGQFDMNGKQNSVTDLHFNQPYDAKNVEQTGQLGFTNDFYGGHQPVNVSHQSFQASEQFPYDPSSGRSPDGRPPHTLFSFGFGGKLVVMKDNSSSFGSQASCSISIFNVMETFAESDTSSYTRTLCHQSFPGPLTGGSVGNKDLNKWIDERISYCEAIGSDHRKGELLKLLLSLLKIACQHYGKLRSPFGTNTAIREYDTPESAVAKLFASMKKNGTEYNMYGAFGHCLQHIPPEEQLRTVASEVQNLLVSGRKMEALQCAQEGQLWGPALIIATQLGEQFYVDTVKQMALRQLVAGSPLRTLCLLIAGQPAEVFSTNNATDSGLTGPTLISHQKQNGSSSMLDDWEENLAVITANRTKDDELVITHLGDCLWKDRSEILAAHICYIIAEMNFESYSDTARLCLIGADHWKFPRTYVSPEAIQRTELYEYSKVLGNSQYMLLPFQPYKIVYAYMLAEVGKLSDALKYCQTVQKSLKTGRTLEVDTWKQLISSLEERIRLHQQGGFTNLAPAKLVGKLLNFFDSTAHRVVGGLPPPAPTSNNGNTQPATRVLSSQSTMAMSSLMPSQSMEPISAWAGDGNKKKMHNRSVSEPDFSRTPREVDSSTKESSSEAQGKRLGASLSGRFNFLQKTVDLVRWSRGRQAKLGEENKFYYDENLKRWVEKGIQPAAEEPALPPPPTTGTFTSDFGGSRPTTINEMSLNSETIPPKQDSSSGMPPIPSNSNQFSARGRTGVRARYVDTFNQGSSNVASNTFRPPAAQSVRPSLAGKTNFFVPTTPAHTEEQSPPSSAESNPLETPDQNHMSTSASAHSFQTPPASTMQRFPSMDHIRGSSATPSHSGNPYSRRTASWGGNYDSIGTNPVTNSGLRPLGEVLGLPHSAYMSDSNTTLAEDLQEVEL